MLALAINSELNTLLLVSVVILIIGLILKRLKQPYVLAYILSGVILGPHVLGVVTDYELVTQIGDIGLIILMFFIGMHISVKDLLKQWKGIFAGTSFQIFISIILMFLVGHYLNWSFNRSLLLGFIISLSSSAVVIRLIENLGTEYKDVGNNVLGILIFQDILIIPMIISLNFLAGSSIIPQQLAKQIIGGFLIIAFAVYIYRKGKIRLPFEKSISKDHELQIFAAFILCFGLALITSLFELSAGLGALMSGVIVNNTESGSDWLHDSLDSFRILLISVFFLSIGMLIDLNFLIQNWQTILIVVSVVYISNQGINTIGLRLLGNTWKHSILGGAMLAQIGEFSFVLATIGHNLTLLTSYGYQITIIVISITIMVSSFWVAATKKLL